MTKHKKRVEKKKKIKKSEQTGPDLLNRLEKPRFFFGYLLVLIIIISFLYQPMIFKGMEPNGSDFISNIGVTNQLNQWEEKTGHFPLWNPYMFGGMPIYQHFAPRAWSIDNLLNSLDFLGDWRLWYFLTGAIGIYLLVIWLGLPAVAAMMAGLAFVLMPHFQALIIVGHFAKFRALMWIPFVLLTFLYLVRERTILSSVLFSLAFAIQFRTQHYQIIFYTLLLLLFFGTPPLFRFIREKNWTAVFRLTGLSVLALLFAFIIAAQIFLSIREYTPYSTRGGYAISLKEAGENQQERKGVGFDYATSWSYSVSEFWNLIIPKFHGGTSNEVYTGDSVPQLKNREFPAYWGSMPFTQSYEYIGILIIFLALIGIVFFWEKWEVKSLTFLTLLALIMSLGKNFPVLYKSFFYYIPYFDKFRAPVMILTLVMFNCSVLAAYGLAFLIRTDIDQREIVKRFYFITGFFAFLLIIPIIFGSTFSLSRPEEIQRYGQQAVNMLKQARLELLINSSLQSLIFLLLGAGTIFSLRKKWIKPGYLGLAFLFLICMDFIILNSPYLKSKFVDTENIERSQYQVNAIDQKILQDDELSRVFPFGQLFSDVHWVYHHQSIGGYSPAKLQVIQEIVDNCLYHYLDDQVPINWNILKMLNVKYVIMPQQVQHPRLDPIAQVENKSFYGYRFNESSPRAFFINDYEIISDGVERLKMLNNPKFNPDSMAVLEEEPQGEILFPDSSSVQIQEFTPEKIVLRTFSDKPALLVISEITYPPGWKAVLDGRDELRIYKTNHLLQSVVVPEGKHTIELTFRPKSYYAGVRISVVSIILLYLLILILGYHRWGRILLHKIKGFKLSK
ncbi:MAG: hypothetical protein JXL67_13255 [Calditrichaeota bacterium]|nr:hypothetical protein [Calditrichota bacterium]